MLKYQYFWNEEKKSVFLCYITRTSLPLKKIQDVGIRQTLKSKIHNMNATYEIIEIFLVLVNESVEI